jgi:septal ring factor EnvC (AmiA/AmiB activator)
VTRSRFVAAFVAAALATLVSAAGFGAPAPLRPDAETGVPVTQAGKLPKTEDRYRALKQQVERARPGVENARQKSAALAAQAASVRQRLIDTARQVQGLEREKSEIESQVARLAAQEKAMAAVFARDRIRVAHLLAVLERLQTDLPPAVALEPADALRSSRGAMVLGASLPRIYGAAAALARQLDALKATQAMLLNRRAAGVRTAAKLSAAEATLDQLLATKERAASGASAAYQAMQAKLDAIGAQAADLKSLLDRVTALRNTSAPQGMVVVGAGQNSAQSALKPGSLAQPVMGQVTALDPAQAAIAGPGLDYVTAADAAVVAPADSEVLFAGPYHKTGQVLILQTSGGYDLVLAGLDRVDVRPGDRLLAGEPVGRMPRGRNGAKLYFELRQNGKGVSPAPWLGIDLRKAKRS